MDVYDDDRITIAFTNSTEYVCDDLGQAATAIEIFQAQCLEVLTIMVGKTTFLVSYGEGEDGHEVRIRLHPSARAYAWSVYPGAEPGLMMEAIDDEWRRTHNNDDLAPWRDWEIIVVEDGRRRLVDRP